MHLESTPAAGEKKGGLALHIKVLIGFVLGTVIGGRPLPIGRYELRFAIGDHFRSRGIEQGDPPFLDIVPVRFSIAPALVGMPRTACARA